MRDRRRRRSAAGGQGKPSGTPRGDYALAYLTQTRRRLELNTCTLELGRLPFPIPIDAYAKGRGSDPAAFAFRGMLTGLLTGHANLPVTR